MSALETVQRWKTNPQPMITRDIWKFFSFRLFHEFNHDRTAHRLIAEDHSRLRNPPRWESEWFGYDEIAYVRCDEANCRLFFAAMKPFPLPEVWMVWDGDTPNKIAVGCCGEVMLRSVVVQYLVRSSLVVVV